jgi:hypothetical protein
MWQRRLQPGSIACAALVAVAMLIPTVTPVRAEPAELVRQHGLGLGYQGITFGTEAGDQYTLHGPSVMYDYFRGRRWGFMTRLAAAYLVGGRMSGPSGEFSGGLGDLYDQRRCSADLLLMVGRRKPLAHGLVLIGAAGPHLQGFSLTGTRYSPVEDISVGLGGLGKLDYPLNPWLSLSAQIAIGLDPFDLVDHQNPAGWVIPFSSTFALAAHH